jgi:phytoene synthase
MSDPTTTTDSPESVQITRNSKSNFALAFITLPKERRQAMVSYYAFCRVVDDIVDEPGPTRSERLALLDRWRCGFEGDINNPNSFEQEVFQLQSTYDIPTEHFHLLIDGMEMDLDTKRYDTIEELLGYCYRVASSVGLVCMRIFGCDPDTTLDYATNLGYCLQLTNIMRDVAEDWRNDERIYIPREDLDRFDLSESLFENGPQGTRFLEMMEFQHERTVNYYDKTLAALPKQERRRVVPTEIMRDTYRAILEAMKRDDFRVFDTKYSLGKLQKVGILTRRMVAGLV